MSDDTWTCESRAPKRQQGPFGHHREPVRTYPLSIALLCADQIINSTAAPLNIDVTPRQYELKNGNTLGSGRQE